MTMCLIDVPRSCANVRTAVQIGRGTSRKLHDTTACGSESFLPRRLATSVELLDECHQLVPLRRLEPMDGQLGLQRADHIGQRRGH